LRPDGKLARLVTDMSRFSLWGSSSAQLSHSAFQAMANRLGFTFYGGGKGGELAEHTCARLGSRPMRITFSGNVLPTSGTVVVTSSNVPPSANMASYTGTIIATDENGKPVVVGGTMTSTAGELKFTRSSGVGPAYFVAPDTLFWPTVGQQFRDAAAGLWIGKNNFSSTVAGREQVVIELTREAFAYMSALTTRTIVIGHFADTNTPEGSMERQQIITTNAEDAAFFGELHLDVYDWCTGPEIWEDLDITPTSEDLDQQAIGNKPPSASLDNGHFSPLAYGAINKRLERRAIQLGWY